MVILFLDGITAMGVCEDISKVTSLAWYCENETSEADLRKPTLGNGGRELVQRMCTPQRSYWGLGFWPVHCSLGKLKVAVVRPLLQDEGTGFGDTATLWLGATIYRPHSKHLHSHTAWRSATGS